MSLIKTKKNHLYLCLVLILCMMKITNSSIPTVTPENPLLNSQSNYMMNYFSFRPFQTSSFFQLDFTQTDIIVNDGQLNVTASLNRTAVNSSSITANCTNKICLIKLRIAFAINTNVEILFGQVRNPRYTASQRINVLIYFGVNSN